MNNGKSGNGNREQTKNARSAQRKDPLSKNFATPCVDLQTLSTGNTASSRMLKNAQSAQRKDPLSKNSTTPCVSRYVRYCYLFEIYKSIPSPVEPFFNPPSGVLVTGSESGYGTPFLAPLRMLPRLILSVARSCLPRETTPGLYLVNDPWPGRTTRLSFRKTSPRCQRHFLKSRSQYASVIRVAIFTNGFCFCKSMYFIALERIFVTMVLIRTRSDSSTAHLGNSSSI